MTPPDIDSIRGAYKYASAISSDCSSRLRRLERQGNLTPDEAGIKDRLQDLVPDLERFIKDFEDP